MNHPLLPDWNIEGDVPVTNQKKPMGLVLSVFGWIPMLKSWFLPVSVCLDVIDFGGTILQARA